MSEFSLRARALDASKPLPLYMADEVPDAVELSRLNREITQISTGMEKEEETEQDLQRAICSGTVIPIPEICSIEDLAYYSDLYPQNIKMPRQLICMRPFSMEADIPEYDMDSDDEAWLNSQANRLGLNPVKFEQMMDRLENGSGQIVVTLQEAKALIKEDDDLIIAVYDYWLNKRLKTQHPLIPQVRTEVCHGDTTRNPYIAFRRRGRKIQTRKTRKDDESAYEKMIMLKRNLTSALTILEMLKRREESQRKLLNTSIELFEKRYQAGDYAGQMVSEALEERSTSTSTEFTPIFPGPQGCRIDLDAARPEEKTAPPASLPEQEEDDEEPFAFRPKAGCLYQAPAKNPSWPWCAEDEGGVGDKRSRHFPTSLPNIPNRKNDYKFVGYARRRIGRGGRMVLDRINCRGGYDASRSLVNESAESTTGNESAYQSSVVNSSQGVNAEVSVDVPTDASPPNSPPNVANLPSPEPGCLHYRPKTTELISNSDAMFDSLPQTEFMEVDSTSSSSLILNQEQEQEESSWLLGLPSLFSSTPEDSPFVGVMVSGGDMPLVYSFQPDPPLSRGDPLSRQMDISSDSILLDESSATLVNGSYLQGLGSSNVGLSLNSENRLGGLRDDARTTRSSSVAVGSADSTSVLSSTTANTNCVLSTGQSSEHIHNSNNEQGSLIPAEGIAKAIFGSSRGRRNPDRNNGKTLANKSYTFLPPTIVSVRPIKRIVKRIRKDKKK